MENNNSNKGREAWRIALLTLGVTVALFCIVLDIIMLKSLLTPWWIPAAILLPVVLVLALPFRSVTRWLTDSPRTWWNVL